MTEEQKPTYHDFLKRLLSQKRLNKEIVDDILNQYKEDPNGFEADFYQMHRYLNFMGLRSQDADFIALAFHSQVGNRPEWELAQSYGIMLPTSLQQRSPYPSGPQGRAGGPPQYGNQPAPQDDSFDIKSLMKLKQEMEIMKEIFKDDAPPASQVPTDPMQYLMPMMMMNPNMQMQAKMGKDSQGNDVIQGFTMIPSAQGPQGNDFVTNILSKTMDKSDRMEQALLDTVMGNKDEKIAKLEQKIGQISETRGSDYVLEELKRFQDFNRIMNPGATSGGDPDVAMQLAQMQMKNDRDMAELSGKQEEQRFRNNLILREYVDARSEKMAQMQMAEKAMGTLSDNVGKIITDIGAPLASAASVGVAEQLKSSASPGQAPPTTGTSGQPRLEDLTDAQLQEAIQKAKELRVQSDKTKSQMLQYEQAFQAEMTKRSTAPIQKTDGLVPLDGEVEEVAEWDGKSSVDIDPSTFTVTE